MGQIQLQRPDIGQPDSSEEPKVVNNFTLIQDLVNGRLDSTNLSASAGIRDTQLGSSPLSASWRTIYETYVLFNHTRLFVAPATNIQYVVHNVANTYTESGAPYAQALPFVVPDTFASSAPTGRSAQFRLVLTLAANAINPAMVTTASLRSLAFPGTAANFALALGPQVGNSAANGYLTSAHVVGVSSVFTIANLTLPHVIALSNSGTPAVDSATQVVAELQARYV